jgi:peptidyl-tRNA hydrolase
MSPGKTASQAGHAYVGAAILAQQQSPDLLSEYHQDFPASPGTKVCLEARNLDQILRAKAEAEAAGIPTFLVVDSGCENFFNGEPIVTALGIGPARKDQIKHITKRFQLVK